jgi:mannosyltransferase OCH1-like enzyme
MGTALEGRYDILDGNDVIATKADIMRVLILNHYDGVYIDFDSLFLQA